MKSYRAEISLLALMIFAMLSPICFATPPSLPFDSFSAQVTPVSIEGNIATLRIDRIVSYVKGPIQAAPLVEVGQEINTHVYFVGLGNGDSAISDIILGQNYFANIEYCISDEGLICGYEGWSAAIYPAQQIPPPAEERGYLLIILVLLILAAMAYTLSRRSMAKQNLAQADIRKSNMKERK